MQVWLNPHFAAMQKSAVLTKGSSAKCVLCSVTTGCFCRTRIPDSICPSNHIYNRKKLRATDAFSYTHWLGMQVSLKPHFAAMQKFAVLIHGKAALTVM
jgi:hypothetical protein